MTNKPKRARAEHGHHVALGDGRAEHGVHRAGHGLDGHRVGVAQALGHGVELAGVRDEARARPAAARVGAEPGLQAGPDVAEGEIPAVADVPGLAGGAGRLDPSGRAAEHRLQHDPGCPPPARAPSAPTASSATVPTTSWPGTKGKETMSSK